MLSDWLVHDILNNKQHCIDFKKIKIDEIDLRTKSKESKS